MEPGKVGRITDPHVAFWHIAKFFTTHPDYRKVPFAHMQFLQQAIDRRDYFILGDGKTIHAIATWRRIDLAELRRLDPHAPSRSESIDRIFLTNFAAADHASLKIMVQQIKTNFLDKDIYWDRHKGKLGYRLAKRRS